ncbi:hypothetical protein BJ165DRAFT_1521868 [Panaeolus papilionaceus]|nr:hypothetical protein BJ165DRAFT_1521868 [Panaeolus papilionaceus]
MATPSSIVQEEDAILSDSSNTDDTPISPSIRKRSRESLEDIFDDNIWDTTDDGRPKTRRVNPQRLAIRLGPDLVAEMEALIVPGAKMPTFAVRKDFQERYCVDRRHIYDYFHSRGLRVAKEDKHTNLIRGRAMKAQAQLQAQQAQSESIDKRTPEDPTDNQDSTKPPQPRSLTVPTPSGKPLGRPAKRTMKAGIKKPRVARRLPSLSDSVKPRKKPWKVFLDVPKNDNLTPQLPYFTASSGTDTEWEATCPQFTLPSGLAGDNPEDENPATDFLNSPDDFVAGYFDTPMDIERAIHDVDANAASNDLHSLMLIEDQDMLLNGHVDGYYNWNSYSPLTPYAEVPGTSTEKILSGHTATKGMGMKGLNIAAYLAADYPEFCRWLEEPNNHCDISTPGTLTVDFGATSAGTLGTSMPGSYSSALNSSSSL